MKTVVVEEFEALEYPLGQEEDFLLGKPLSSSLEAVEVVVETPVGVVFGDNVIVFNFFFISFIFMFDNLAPHFV